MPNNVVLRAGTAMRRRDFMKIIGGTVASWPLAAHAQPRERMRHIASIEADSFFADPQANGRSIGYANPQRLRIAPIARSR
jgi:hypothetical protein